MEKMPLLGSGKIDNMAVTKLVKEMAAAKPRRSRWWRSYASFRRAEARAARAARPLPGVDSARRFGRQLRVQP